MYRVYISAYGVILFGIGAGNYLSGKNIYQTLTAMVENRMQHFFLCSFFVFLLYCIGRLFVHVFVGKLSALESEGVQDNSLRYLGNLCLVVTLFADDITMRGMVLFGLVFGMKVLHWIVGLRIESFEKGSRVGVSRIGYMCGVLAALDALFLWRTLLSALDAPGISILFGFEFAVLLMFSLRCIYAYVLLQMYSNESIESKIFLMFYGDMVFGVCRIIAHIVCLVWTTIYFRMPINLLRECILVAKVLFEKVQSITAYKNLLAHLNKLPNKESNELCLICHDELGTAKQLECSHMFHLDCLKEWLHRQQVCPVCRNEVLPKKQRQREPSAAAEEAPQSSARMRFAATVDGYEAMPVTIEETSPV